MDSIYRRQDFLNLVERNINEYVIAYVEQNQRILIEKSDMDIAIKAIMKDISNIL